MLALQSKKLCILLLFCIQTFHSALGRTESYCESTIDLYRYSKDLHFVGEIGDLDYGVVNMSKTLNCCAYGFTTIEWLKDNQPYPWSQLTSSFVVDQSTDNQTLVSRKAMRSDSGLYTCIVKNGTATIRHEIELEILVPGSANNPRMTYATKDQTGNLGGFARLYCEGFVGMVTGWDKNCHFSGTITWEKGLSLRYLDRSFIDGIRVIQYNYRRDENQILGSYLIFINVKPEDMNMYTCRITNGNFRAVEQRAWILDSRDPEEIARILFMIVFALLPLLAFASVLSLLAGIVVPKEAVDAWLKKNGPQPGTKDKNKDILVLYHADDESLMSKTIIPKFMDLYPIKVTLYPVYDNEQDLNKLLKKAKTYDGVMAVMTRNLTGNVWSCESISLSIRIFSKVQTFIYIFPKRLPPLQGKNGQKLKETFKKAEFQVLSWKSCTSGKVFKTCLKKTNRKTRRLFLDHVHTKRNKFNEDQV